MIAWARDTITHRFVITITLAFAATFAMNWLFATFAGVWGQPAIMETGLLDRAATTVRIVEAQPPGSRDAIAMAAGNGFIARWYPEGSPVEATGRISRTFDDALIRMRELLDDPDRRIVFLDWDSPEMAGSRLSRDPVPFPRPYFMGVALSDGGWLYFIVAQRKWGITSPERRMLELAFVVLSIVISAALTGRSLARPIRRLSLAVQRFGTDPHAPPIAASGPQELRVTIEAFNAMQAQIRRFVTDRMVMLAAISHDLRTPLTRMRLRGEFVEDALLQQKLFRDVDEMQEMIDSALSFFRDDAGQEDSTAFDMAELLQSLVDDYGDQGIVVGFDPPERLVQVGRPFALRRVVANLIDNAIKYATDPVLSLRQADTRLCITLRDRGPGIPERLMENVFAPFFRLDSSRSRSTGGVGLGLTSARSIVRAHGGELHLRNHPDGGLEARIELPRSAVPMGGTSRAARRAKDDMSRSDTPRPITPAPPPSPAGEP